MPPDDRPAARDATFDIQQFQVFDFEAMRAYPALLEPLLFYVCTVSALG